MADRVRSTTLILAIAACDPSAETPSSPQTRPEDARALVDAVVGRSPGPLEYHEADALGPEHAGRRVKAHGFVREGSIQRHTETGAIRFEIGTRDPPLVVRYTGVLPDQFQEKLEVIVTGELASDGRTLTSDDLVAKCPTSYENVDTP
jgi:hypothetical protein